MKENEFTKTHTASGDWFATGLALAGLATVGPVAGGLFAASQGAGVAAGSVMAVA